MNRHRAYSLGGLSARLLGFIVRRWTLVLVIAFFASPVGPHVRIQYVYTEPFGSSGQRHYRSCLYLGSRGFIRPAVEPDCPIIAFLDAREARR